VSTRAVGSRRVPASPPLVDRVGARLGLDRVELAALTALSGLSLVILAALATKGRPLSGADGLLAADQLQYFAWIREAAHHGLIGNRFDLAPGPRSFLHPGYGLSGALHALGLSVPLSYLLLWKPVAVGVAFVGALRYVRRLLPAGPQRHVGLVLVLFAVMPASAIVAWTGWGGDRRQYTFDFISGEMYPVQWLWGYLMTAIAVFMIPLVLLAYEGWRSGRAGPRRLWLAAGGALLVCWLQPWQGATLALIVVGVEGWRWLRGRERPAVRGAALVGAAVALPALYYLLLSVYDPAWRLAGQANAAGAMTAWSWPWWAIALTVLPLAAPAALAYRMPAPTWQDHAVRLWPFAALAVYLQPTGTFPYHSFQGLAIPLSVLAVQGAVSLRPHWPRWLVVAMLAVMTLPGLAHKLEVAANSVRAGGDPYFVFPDEVRALRTLEEDPRPGGVLGPTYAGYMLPYTTGRQTYIGAISWSPDWHLRSRLANDLFEGRLTGEPARDFVRSTRARWLFADCRPLADITETLRPMLARVQRMGCATIYELRFRPEMAAAAGAPDE
jgi:hypothetical protein